MIYRISNEFSFHTMYYETSCVFYIPEPLARGYKTHEFHDTSYGMKIHLRFFLSHELFRESGTDDAVACYALITSLHGTVLLLSEQDNISLLLKTKTPRRACFDVITKANSLFDNLCTFTNAQ